VLDNNIIYQNRAFHIGQVGGNPVPGANQVVTLTPQLNQMGTGTGSCPSGASYWDIGAYGDSGPGNTSSGLASRKHRAQPCVFDPDQHRRLQQYEQGPG